ncbi:SGNH/GDSL hydrolase family protein [Salipaludibacillus sp. CF4.18]|uniref:SGNH/GDSL hydrolase family protein n=1 Tax=Salipaludibacillus sp. CF4.18 TaxID=3373081 RepID=UPI003EE4A1F0
MKKIIFISVIVLSLSAIIFGRLYYSNKLEDISASAHEQLGATKSELSESNVSAGSDEDGTEESNIDNEHMADLEKLTEGLLPSVKSKIFEKGLENEEIELVIFGSKANEDSLNLDVVPWPELLESHLNSGYSQDLFAVNNQAFGELTSNEIIEAGYHTDVAELDADIVILESFNWSDNNASPIVPVEDTVSNLQTMVNVLKEENSEVIVFVQPPQPAHGAIYYPVHVETISEYAEENEIQYIDHWEAWPSKDDDDLLGFMEEGESMPNQQGHDLWMKYIASYFINEVQEN